MNGPPTNQPPPQRLSPRPRPHPKLCPPTPLPVTRSRKRQQLLALLLLCGLLIGIAGALGGWHELHAPRLYEEPILFELRPGVSFRAAARKLEAVGLIRSPRLLELYARSTGLAHRIKSGSYRFVGEVSPVQVLRQITVGVPGGDLRVTLPEGLTRWEVATRLEQAGICGAALFLASLTEEQEGRLFPDTYRFFPRTPPAEVIATLVSRFETIWSELLAAHPLTESPAGRQGLSPTDLVILASLVEREARVAEERPLVARVFLNRLARKMPLQSDPTCVYGPTTYAQVPTPRLCHDPTNRYSTYVRAGLPPGPIANPGRHSLRAVLEPASQPEALELLFFVARRDGSGRHDFSRTGTEHEEKVDRYLRRGGR